MQNIYCKCDWELELEFIGVNGFDWTFDTHKLDTIMQKLVNLNKISIIFLFVFHFLVKFLREVTPYFRKASIISEVGWELQRAFLCPLSTASTIINPNGSTMLSSTSSKTMSPPSAPKSPPRADTRYIPLQLTHLARNLKYHDPGNANGTLLTLPFYSIYDISKGNTHFSETYFNRVHFILF